MHHHPSPGNSCDLSRVIVNTGMCLCAALYIHVHGSDFVCHMNEIQATELDIIQTISVFLHQVPLQDTVEAAPDTAASSQRKQPCCTFRLKQQNMFPLKELCSQSLAETLKHSHIYTLRVRHQQEVWGSVGCSMTDRRGDLRGVEMELLTFTRRTARPDPQPSE